MKKAFVILVLYMSFALVETAVSGTTILGILEKPQCKEEVSDAVRAIFVKKDKNWISLDTENEFNKYILKQMTWTIAFDGRKAGTVKTFDQGFNTEYSWTFSRDRILSLKQDQTIPPFPNKSARFSGWCWAPPIRPVVVVFEGGASDPDKWKPVNPSSKVIDFVFTAFKAKAGQVKICPNSSDEGIPFNYTVKETEVLKSYKDKKGRKLISLRLKPIKETDVCGMMEEPEWCSHSFLLTHEIVYLGHGLELVDAGDYDNDGHSEVVFWYSGYNRDGYILIYDNFSRKAEYLWGYH